MGRGHRFTRSTDTLDGGPDRTGRRPPPEHQQLRITRRVVDLERRYVGGDPLDLLTSDLSHTLVVLGLVADVARPILPLEPADPMLEAGGARDGPGTGEPFVPRVREEVGAVRLRELGVDGGERIDIRK